MKLKELIILKKRQKITTNYSLNINPLYHTEFISSRINILKDVTLSLACHDLAWSKCVTLSLSKCVTLSSSKCVTLSLSKCLSFNQELALLKNVTMSLKKLFRACQMEMCLN